MLQLAAGAHSNTIRWKPTTPNKRGEPLTTSTATLELLGSVSQTGLVEAGGGGNNKAVLFLALGGGHVGVEICETSLEQVALGGAKKINQLMTRPSGRAPLPRVRPATQAKHMWG